MKKDESKVIKIKSSVKRMLDNYKVSPSESYSDVIKRAVTEAEK